MRNPHIATCARQRQRPDPAPAHTTPARRRATPPPRQPSKTQQSLTLPAPATAETFDKDIGKRWTVSEWKDADSTGKWVHTPGEWFVESAKKEAHGMQASEDMKFHSISAPLDKKA